jgi:NADH:ubiquinone oxidoreductase subunit K
MKRNVLVYGLISGICVATFMVASIAYCYNKDSFEGSMLLGYAAMLLSFSLIFVGVKNYRDKFNGGVITFGKAFMMSLYMALIASTLYVVGWMIAYYNFFPDFIDKLAAYQLSSTKTSQMSAEQITAVRQQIDMFREWYSSWIGVAGATYMEILPVGLLVSIITALVLKRKKPKGDSIPS